VINEHLFISDIHIGAFNNSVEEQIENDLIDLVNYAIDRNAQIYILGDLFDYWMEFTHSKYIPSIGKKVLDIFEQYNNSISKALFITGNHDNWTINHFSERGFEVESEFRIIELFDKKVFLMHGDGLLNTKKILKRPMFNQILRNNFFLLLYRNLLPKGLALNLMKLLSNSSKKIRRKDPIKLNKNAQLILTSNIADVVLTGHDHIPRVETFNSGLYINLGNFFHERTLVRGINSELSLVRWHAKSKTFKNL
jgi:UDP-2,3-diacylglucosamine pyrophosphatase LpxH